MARAMGVRVTRLRVVSRRCTTAGRSWRPGRSGAELGQRKRLCVFRDLDGRENRFHRPGRFTPGAGRPRLRLVPEDRALRIACTGPETGKRPSADGALRRPPLAAHTDRPVAHGSPP